MKKDPMLRAGVTTLLMLGVMLAFARAGAVLPESAVRDAASELLDVMQRRELNQEAIADQTAGYYEGLLNESGRVSSMSAILSGRLGRSSEASAADRILAVRRPDRFLMRDDFLFYEQRPNLDLPDYEEGGPRMVTNSVGLSDVEYSVERRPSTRRVAVLGDSVTRGLGAPFGTSYEALLEEALNRQDMSPEVQGFEVINFAVGGYRLTQVLDAAVVKAAAYRPDLYVVPLTELSLARRWGDHVKALVAAGIDLKYEFLREVVRASNLLPDDSAETADAKLAPYRIETVRQILLEIQARAATQDADVIVLLVPTVRESKQLRAEFAGVHEMLGTLDIPVIDLLNTFENVQDLDRFRVSPDNFHPNQAGHARLFERLYRSIRSDPAIRAAVIGPAPEPPVE
jgi:lysophospholipase L1-like esterase